MHFKLPRQEPYTLAALSPTSTYHLRAACAKIEDDEISQADTVSEHFCKQVFIN